MGKTYFITGTDTDAGKTFVSCGILESALNVGASTAGVKPIAAGGHLSTNGFRNQDALSLQAKSSLPLSYKQVNPVLFQQAIAPHIAAAKNNVKVRALELAEHCKEVMNRQADLTIIEGAGGWKVPLNNKEYLSDMVKIIQLPVILVVPIKLGCLNHALLTAQAILEDGLPFFGWIANQVQSEMEGYAENIDTLRELLPAPLLTEIKYERDFNLSTSCADQINPQMFL